MWLACALLAKRKTDSLIQALIRWKSPESIKVYAKMQPQEYVAHLLDALDAKVSPELVDRLPPCDADAGYQRIHERIYGRNTAGKRSKQSRPAASKQAQRTTEIPAAAPALQLEGAADDGADAAGHTAEVGAGAADDTDADGDVDSDDDSEPDDQGDVVSVSGKVSIAELNAGMRVGVCFFDKAHRPTYYGGVVVKVMTATARVKFREFEDTYLNYDVAFDRIFTIEPHSELK